MKYLKRFQDITFEIKTPDDRYPLDKKVIIYDHGEHKGEATISYKRDFFSYTALHGELEDDSIPDSDVLYIVGIRTHSDRGIGYGSKLVNRIEEYAKDKGFKYVALGSITSALGFWKKVGYKIYSTGEYFNMYKKL